MSGEDWTQRTKLLIGERGVKRLANSNVCVVGVGGVGGYAAILLARAGVGNLTIVDSDVVDITNINRQIVANISTVGLAKVDIMKQQILQINPNCNVTTFQTRFSADTAAQILLPNFAETQQSSHSLHSAKSQNFYTFSASTAPSQLHFDYVVDCIDSVSDKVELICFCKKHKIPIVSAMGAGNRVEIPHFDVLDIFKTQNDGLAKAMRKRLRERGVDNLDVVCSAQKPQKLADNISLENSNNNNLQQNSDTCENFTQAKEIGSISYQPAMCGCVLAGFVVNKLLLNIQKNSNDNAQNNNQ